MRLFVFLLLATFSQASSAVDSAAPRLVQAARFDYAAKLATTLALQGQIPTSSFDCVAAIPLATYTLPIANVLESRLNPEDLAAAISFYESPTGRKYTQHGIVQFYEAKSIPTDLVAPSITKSEMQEIISFSRTGAGAKLINREFPREMVLAVKPAEDKALRACGYKGAL